MLIPADDRGLTLGDGLFETLLSVDGEPVWLASHLERLARGCAALGLPAPDMAQAERLIRAAPADAGLAVGRSAVRLTVTAGSGGRGLDRPAAPVLRMLATAAPAPAPAGGVRLRTAHTVGRNAGSPASRLKTLAYLDNVLARAEAQAAGADEAVMLNTRGEIACAAAANLFWVSGGRLFTPALDCGVLDGCARARVIELARAAGAPVQEARAGAEALAAAEAVFVTNSLIGLRPCTELDGRILASSRLAERLAQQLVQST